MAEFREIRDVFERDLNQIAVPPQSEWFRVAPTERPMPKWLLATTAVAAIVVALVFGSYLYSRLPAKPGPVLAPPTPTATLPSGFAEVGGRVTDAVSGAPISGVRVYFVNTDQLGVLDAAAKALTDASGRYQVTVLPRAYRVLFFSSRGGQIGVCPTVCGPDPVVATPYEPLWWPNGASESQGALLVVDRDRSDVDASLREGHEITGSFTFEGKGVRAFVVVHRAAPRDLVGVTTTNTDGTFRIAVSDGTYYIEFAPLDRGPMGGAWPADIVVQGADAVGINRVEP
jgi:carboxypeptidase family protein